MILKLSKIHKKVSIFVVFTACLLFCSIILHTLDVHHSHPAFLGEGIQALAHGEDKKFLAVLAAIFVLALVEDFFGRGLDLSIQTSFLPAADFEPDTSKQFNYLFNLLRRGLLEPRPA